MPAMLFWVFFFMRPWVWLFVRNQDPWRFKRMFLLVIVPILVLNMVETTAGDCRYAVGLLATLCWALAERRRLEYHEARREPATTAPALRLPRRWPAPAAQRGPRFDQQ